MIIEIPSDFMNCYRCGKYLLYKNEKERKLCEDCQY